MASKVNKEVYAEIAQRLADTNPFTTTVGVSQFGIFFTGTRVLGYNARHTFDSESAARKCAYMALPSLVYEKREELRELITKFRDTLDDETKRALNTSYNQQYYVCHHHIAGKELYAVLEKLGLIEIRRIA